MMENELIGREEEQKILLEALESNEAEMISIIGRRRIGKTFLIRETYKGRIDFQITGLQNAPLKEQLINFKIHLSIHKKSDVPSKTSKNWLETFYALIQYLESLEKKEKLVVFFDELPWLSTHKSGFLRALGFFWNSWASMKNIVVVICGSAASWMIRKVVHHKGGLHNRITKRIFLEPFTLAETELFLQSKNIKLSRYQIIQLYMIMGGVPHYLKEIKAGFSATQNIDRICFSKSGVLYDEFSKLYEALFEQPDKYIAVIRALATKWKGLSRKEIITIAKIPNGGTTSKILTDLISSGFVSSYYPFNKKKKDLLYRLTDEYSLFYLQFIEKKMLTNKGIWERLSETPVYKSWSGYAFESLCMKHIPQIKKALGISGVYTEVSSFVHRGNEDTQGIQIDLLIDRNDHVINVCELKFYKGEFTITKSYAKALRTKAVVFKELSKTKKQVMLTLITTFGLKANQHSIGLIDRDFDMDILFEKE